jgi:hypothetical protein
MKMRKWLCALVLPVFVQMAAFLWLTYNGDLIDAMIGFVMNAILFSLFWGLLGLIPLSIAQILCARSPIKADCRNYERFLVGVLNPGIAISLLVVSGLIAWNTSN